MRISDWSSDVCSSDLAPYRYYKKLLQFVQWQNGTSGVPMLLKGPSHTPHMDMLHEYFPDAKFVQIHRDPVTCVASMGKVVWMLHQLQPIQGKDSIADSRSEEHTSELQSLMRISYAVFCLKKKNITKLLKQYDRI